MTSDPIIDFLDKNGPTLSSRVKDYLLAQGIKDDTARQRLSRATKQGVRQLKGYFPDKAAFLYLDKQYKQPPFWINLLHYLTETNTTYGRALNALIAKGGIVRKAQFHTISSAPTIKTEKHLSSDVILDKLCQLGFLELKTLEMEEYVCFTEQTSFDVQDHFIFKNRQVVEEMVIEHVKEWLKRSSFVSFEAVTSRLTPGHKGYGPFAWDIVGPSYLQPLVSFEQKQQKLNNGFVVADIFIGTELTVCQVAHFIYKASTCIRLGLRPALMILVADWFDKDALNLGRKNGLIFITPTILFGKEVADSLKELLQVLDHAAAVAAKEPDKISRVLQTLSQSKVDFNNLKGALFNLVVGHMVLKGEGGSIDIGKKIYLKTENETIEREMDVLLCVAEHTVTVYECKGYKGNIKKTDVENWVTKKICHIHKALKQEQRFQNANISFEFWTTSDFELEALTYLEDVSAKTTKYGIRWKEKKAILEYSKTKNLSQMRALIKEHY